MTYTRSIALVFLVLGIKPLIESVGINNYFQLINDVHRYYRTPCVIFVRSGNYDLNMTTLVYTWSREFSRQQVMTMTTTFSDLTSEYNEYWKNVTRPLFVILLDTKESMGEFAETTRSIKPISFPIWFVVFLQRPGNPLEEYCRHPTDNIFNVDFSTQMLVLCYARPILVEWYAVRDNRTRTFDLALWSPNTGLLLRTRKNIYARRNNMFGDVLRVAFVKDSPMISVVNGTISGFLGLLIVELSKVLNFTIEILDPVEGFGGWDQQTKIWTGAIGQLITNEADVGVSAFTITNDRLNVIDFTMPLVRSRNRLYFKYPNNTSVEWSLYLRVFSSGSWITLVIVIITASILLTIMKTKGYFSISLMSENYINVWGIYCQQGLSKFPSESPIRLAFLSIYISSIIILAIYSASLISFLALATPKLPFSTLQGYFNDGSYKLIVMKNSAEYYVITDPVYREFHDLLEAEKELPLSVPEGFKQICERHKLAFYTTTLFKEAISVYIQCAVVYINTGTVDNLAMALTKGNPYTSVVNYHLQRFQLNGVMNKLKNKSPIKINPSTTITGTVDLSDVTPSLTIVACSMILALLILIIEKMYYSKTQSFRTQSKNNEPIKKLTFNLGVKNELRKRNSERNSERNLKLQGFYNTKPIGYWS